MFYHDKKTQYTVKVEKPNALFAKALQQALGGIEGEIRVAMQYLFQCLEQPRPQQVPRHAARDRGHPRSWATSRCTPRPSR